MHPKDQISLFEQYFSSLKIIIYLSRLQDLRNKEFQFKYIPLNLLYFFENILKFIFTNPNFAILLTFKSPNFASSLLFINILADFISL